MNVMAEIQRRNYVLYLSVPKEKSRVNLAALQKMLKLPSEFLISEEGWSSLSPCTMENAKLRSNHTPG